MRTLIAGAGIGGLTTALGLHAAGQVDVTLVEAVPELRPLGAGVNFLPNAVRELAAMGLDRELARIAVPVRDLVYYTERGEVIWREPRGLAAGHRFPQLAVHRGRAQMLLLAAVRRCLGELAVRVDHRVTGFRSSATGVRVTTARGDGAAEEFDADVLIGADGIRSAVRRTLYPGEGPPVWQRQVVWRGIARIPAFGGGRSMVIGGNRTWKVVAYPIGPEPDADGLVETNWAVARTLSPDEPADRSSWDRTVRPEKLLAVLGDWRFGDLDVATLVGATPAPFEQPMTDRDPLPRWSFGPVTLVGDAAHPMCPSGSNGTTQAVLDARAVAHALAIGTDVAASLAAYERQRREPTTRLQRVNRALGPEVVVAMADGRSPRPVPDAPRSGTPTATATLPYDELAAVAHQYAQLAGADVGSASGPSPWTVPARTTPAGGPDRGSRPPVTTT